MSIKKVVVSKMETTAADGDFDKLMDAMAEYKA